MPSQSAHLEFRAEASDDFSGKKTHERNTNYPNLFSHSNTQNYKTLKLSLSPQTTLIPPKPSKNHYSYLSTSLKSLSKTLKNSPYSHSYLKISHYYILSNNSGFLFGPLQVSLEFPLHCAIRRRIGYAFEFPLIVGGISFHSHGIRLVPIMVKSLLIKFILLFF